MAATGLRQRHGLRCKGGRCSCPWEASVYSKADARKVRKTFPTRALAAEWQEASKPKVRQGAMRAPNGADLQASIGGVDGGCPQRPDTDPLRASVQASRAARAYDDALRLRVLPTLGAKRLGDVGRNDVQDLADKLLAAGDAPSTISVALLPIRAVYRRAMSRGEVTINPTNGLELPAPRAGRDRIASPDECRRLLAALPAGDRPAMGHGHVRRAQARRAASAPNRGRRPRPRDHPRSSRLGLLRGRDHDEERQGPAGADRGRAARLPSSAERTPGE
jgi:hypothetical protein